MGCTAILPRIVVRTIGVIVSNLCNIRPSVRVTAQGCLTKTSALWPLASEHITRRLFHSQFFNTHHQPSNTTSSPLTQSTFCLISFEQSCRILAYRRLWASMYAPVRTSTCDHCHTVLHVLHVCVTCAYYMYLLHVSITSMYCMYAFHVCNNVGKNGDYGQFFAQHCWGMWAKTGMGAVFCKTEIGKEYFFSRIVFINKFVWRFDELDLTSTNFNCFWKNIQKH